MMSWRILAERGLSYRLAGATWTLKLAPAALAVFRSHVQRWRWTKESVGQLFTRDLTSGVVLVELATMIRSVRSSYARVSMDLQEAMTERELLLASGWHCIGLWHSHPEVIPSPSPTDLVLAADHANAAKPQLTGLVFVIIGTAELPLGLTVGVHDGDKLFKAELVGTWA